MQTPKNAVYTSRTTLAAPSRATPSKTIKSVQSSKYSQRAQLNKSVSFHKSTKIHDKESLQEKLPGAFPPDIVLPSWENWPLMQKLPQLRVKHGEYWSRGELGKSLLVKSKESGFDTSDPYCKVYRVPYDPLHDPTIASRSKQPQIKKLLEQNQLVDKEGRVRCSQREQNEYRAYLQFAVLRAEQEALYKEEVERREKELKQVQELKKLKKGWDDQKEHWLQIVGRGQKIKDEKRRIAIAKYQLSNQKYQQQLSNLRKDRENFRKERQGMQTATLAKPSRHLSRNSLTANERERCQREILSWKQELAEDNRAVYLRARKAEKDEQKRLFWEEKLKAIAHRNQVKEAATNELTKDRKKRVEQREHRFEQHRERLPLIIEKRKAAEKRLWDIVRKYAMIWLTKVRARLEFEKQDVTHVSAFEIQHLLAKCISSIQVENGPKLSVFFGGGVNFKDFLKNLKEHLRKEEEEEEARTKAEADAAQKIEETNTNTNYPSRKQTTSKIRFADNL